MQRTRNWLGSLGRGRGWGGRGGAPRSLVTVSSMKRTNDRITVNSWLSSLGFTSHSCIRPQAATSHWWTDSFALALHRKHPHLIQSKYYEACPHLAMSVSSYVLARAHRYWRGYNWVLKGNLPHLTCTDFRMDRLGLRSSVIFSWDLVIRVSTVYSAGSQLFLCSQSWEESSDLLSC